MQQIGSLGVMLYMLPRFSADGEVLISRAEPLSAKLVALAKKHVEVYRVLKAITTSSIYGALTVEMGTIILAIAGNHGVKLPGFPPGANETRDEEEVAA